MARRIDRSAILLPSTPTLMLLVACVLWGCSFTWANIAMKAVNGAMGAGDYALLGPVWLTAVRMLAAGALWFALVPAARRGWTWRSLARGVLLGLVMGAATAVQNLGLDRTSEGVNAFLTSLTILFVPLLSAAVLRRPPRAILWVGIVMATVGIALMTNATSARRFGLGEFYGVVCAVLFSVQILLVNDLVPRDSVWWLTGAQFLFAGVACAAVCLAVPHGARSLDPRVMVELCRQPAIGVHLVLLTLFPGLAAFGLLMVYQPRMDASRAALIYLTEPVFAAGFAYLARGATMTGMGIVGAGMILLANALVEVLSARRPAAALSPSAQGSAS